MWQEVYTGLMSVGMLSFTLVHADIVYRGEETRGKERETYKDRKERNREIEK